MGSTSKPAGRRRSAKVLIVGCHPDHRDAVTREVDAMGFEYEVVESGALAAEALLDDSYQLLLADAGLGFRGLRTLTSAGKVLNDDFRLVALVDRSARAAARRALSARPHALLRLPASPDDVRDVLTSATRTGEGA